MSPLPDVFHRVFPFLRSAALRERWTTDILRAIPDNETLLDVGAGECMFRPACAHLKYVSQDANQYDGRGDGKGLQTGGWNTASIDIVSDACSIPVEDASFQNILCTEVLEHVPHPERVLRECARILQPGGRLIITVPFASVTHFAPLHFATGFSVYWFQTVLREQGFAIENMHRTGNYFFTIAQELVRVPLVLRRYSPIGVLGYGVFVLTVPMALLLFLLAFLGRNSQELLCFSVCVLARKLPYCTRAVDCSPG